MRKLTLLFTFLLSIIFGIKAQQLEIIGNGEPTLSSIIPINGNWFEYQQKSQTIYPQAKLAPITNKLITKITFFTDVTDIESTNLAWQNNIHVSMENTTKSNLSAG